jgi:hypothetical protein
MPNVIEREMSGAGKLNSQLKDIAQTSLAHWQTGNTSTIRISNELMTKIYCTYIAPNEQMIREHAATGVVCEFLYGICNYRPNHCGINCIAGTAQ